MNRDRLYALRAFLLDLSVYMEKVKKGTYSAAELTDYRLSHGLPILSKFDIGTFVRVNECGTAACALGAAALSDRFPELFITGSISKIIGLKRVGGSVTYGFNAAREYFGIGAVTADFLFAPSGYVPADALDTETVLMVTPYDVVKHISMVLELHSETHESLKAELEARARVNPYDPV